jgi:hypothetical protein
VAERARRLLPAVETAVLPDTTHHCLPMRHADALNRHLLAFLA